jgi:transcriptional regulator with XRE-family HTH domain
VAADEKSAGRPLDATGTTVRKNIRRIRDELGISGPELSEQLRTLNRPIPPLGISRIENGQRRVDVDDLVAIAVALGVSPVTLLMPRIEAVGPSDEVTVTGADDSLRAQDVWEWLAANYPLTNKTISFPEMYEFRKMSWPRWVFEKWARDFEAEHKRKVIDPLYRNVRGAGKSTDGDD